MIKAITFGTDGIRGLVNEDLTAHDFVTIGQAIATVFKNGGERTHKIVIGKDPRLSSYDIEYSIAAGIMAVGVDVLLLGPMPTWALAYIVRTTRDADAGIMITASHNPYEDNGVKVFNPDGSKLSKDLCERIEHLIVNPGSIKLAIKNRLGRPHKDESNRSRYVEFAKLTMPNLHLAGLRIVVDCANGAAYKTAPEVLYELGADVIAINNAPDGTNINRNCGSTHLDALKAEVKRLRADIGIAFDGDADRVKLVDENSREVNGDHILAIIADHWLDNGTLSRGDSIVGTGMTNGGLERHLADLGLSLERTDVGDHNVLARMQTGDHVLGGETSGHIIMRLPRPYGTIGDGLIAALQVLGALTRHDCKASALRVFEDIPQVEDKVTVQGYDASAILRTDQVVQAVKEIERQAQDRLGRILVRPSGTEPVIRVMVEDHDELFARNTANSIIAVIQEAMRLS